MKYIRTKDGIYRVLSEDKISINVEDIHTPAPFDIYCVLKTEIIAQADDLNDLCDEFVVCQKGITICQFANRLWDYKEIKFLANGNDFYGAIWTSKGLIYVAKMNESGCLELI